LYLNALNVPVRKDFPVVLRIDFQKIEQKEGKS